MKLRELIESWISAWPPTCVRVGQCFEDLSLSLAAVFWCGCPAMTGEYPANDPARKFFFLILAILPSSNFQISLCMVIKRQRCKKHFLIAFVERSHFRISLPESRVQSWNKGTCYARPYFARADLNVMFKALSVAMLTRRSARQNRELLVTNFCYFEFVFFHYLLLRRNWRGKGWNFIMTN